MIDSSSTSIRGIISREVIGNILVHRDYSSAYPAKVIIEKDWLRTENWCIPRRHGNIMSDEFTPYPKNPLIQQFFANIGRTDSKKTRKQYTLTSLHPLTSSSIHAAPTSGYLPRNRCPEPAYRLSAPAREWPYPSTDESASPIYRGDRQN